MEDYVACYTKILRYDAVPTLYLPQTHIIIKDNPIDLENLKDVVVYTINRTTVQNDGITTISLQDDSLEKQIFRLESSSSDIKTETQPQPVKKVESYDKDKYSHVKGYPDLYVLQAHNRSLERNVEALQEELVRLGKKLNTNEMEYLQHEEHCKQLETRIANRKLLTQQEQHNILSKVFSEAQIKILLGKKKVTWSNDDMAVGYTIRHLSNKRCYMYLTKTLNIPLPAVSSIKRWIAKKKYKKAVKDKQEVEQIIVITE